MVTEFCKNSQAVCCIRWSKCTDISETKLVSVIKVLTCLNTHKIFQFIQRFHSSAVGVSKLLPSPTLMLPLDHLNKEVGLNVAVFTPSSYLSCPSCAQSWGLGRPNLLADTYTNKVPTKCTCSTIKAQITILHSCLYISRPLHVSTRMGHLQGVQCYCLAKVINTLGTGDKNSCFYIATV
jgi:hypothetical protein